MPIPFYPIDRWIKWKDVERCPYPMFRNHPEWGPWNERDDKRLLLIALDRYAEFITNDQRSREEKEVVRSIP